MMDKLIDAHRKYQRKISDDCRANVLSSDLSPAVQLLSMNG